MAEEETKCPICGGTVFIRDYDRGETTCKKCGYVIDERMIDLGPEWRAFDEEQRERRGRTGAPMTLSVDYSEPVMIEKDGLVRIVKIGEFVDSLLAKAKEVKREANVEIARVTGYKTLVFDDNYKIRWKPIDYVSRHEIEEELYEVELETGRKVRVTASHSLYTVRDNEVIPIEAKTLRPGDFVVAPRTLPLSPTPLRDLNLAEETMKIGSSEFTVCKIPAHVFEKLKHMRGLKDWKKRARLPLSLFLQVYDGENGGEISIKPRGSRNGLPLKVGIDERLAEFLGFYASEGCVANDSIRLTFGPEEEECARRVAKLIRDLFELRPRVTREKHSIVVEVDSKMLVVFLTDILGAGRNAREKRVPPVVLSASEEVKRAFLDAYIRGDGCLYQHPEEKEDWRPLVHLYTSSVSPEFSNDLMYLYLQLGVMAGYFEEEIPPHTIQSTGQKVVGCKVTGTRITSPDMVAKLDFVQVERRKRKAPIENLIPAPWKYRREWKGRRRLRISRELALRIAEKYGDEKLKRLAESDFVFLRVRKIRKVKPTTSHTYDLTILGHENFVGGRGGVCLRDTIHDKGLSTMIDWRDRDSHGKDLTPKRRAQIYRLRKWQRRIRVSDATERNLAFALSEIDRMASHLSLPRNVRETASLIYRKAVEERLIRGRSIEGVAAAALYAACRECKVPRTLDEIAEVARVSKKEIGRSYRFIARELLIHLRPTSPIDYIPRFASELGLSGEVQSKAIELLKEAQARGLTSGRGPTGVAAAAIYIASVLCGERRTQRDVADVARVTEVTVRNRYKELCEKLGLDVEL